MFGRNREIRRPGTCLSVINSLIFSDIPVQKPLQPAYKPVGNWNNARKDTILTAEHYSQLFSTILPTPPKTRR